MKKSLGEILLSTTLITTGIALNGYAYESRREVRRIYNTRTEINELTTSLLNKCYNDSYLANILGVGIASCGVMLLGNYKGEN